VSRSACIIPVVGNTEGLEATLVSVLERRPDGCEVLVVLNIPYHDPYGLQGEIQILQASPDAGLVECINRGISATNAPIVHILAAGYEVETGWIERAQVHFEDPRVAAVTPVVHDRNERERILTAGVRCGRGGKRIVRQQMPASEELATTGPTLQAAFYRKAALEAFGGLPKDVGNELADVDLAASLLRAKWLFKFEADCRISGSSIPAHQHGGFSSGVTAERFYWRHLTESGGISGLPAHWLTAIAETLRCKPIWKAPTEILGRLAAFCQFGHYRRHRQMMVDLERDALVAQQQWQAMNVAKESGGKGTPDSTLRVDGSHGMAQPKKPARQRSNAHQKR
jgi:hypothetical protein